MLQAYLQVECAVVHGSRQMIHWKPYAYYLVVLLFRGIFRDVGFQRILTAAFAAPGRRLELVTVLADSHFDFPSLEDSVDSGDWNPVRRSLTDETSSPSQQLAEAQRELLTVLALPFSPLASEGLQHKQVAEVAHRMHRYEEPAKAASLDEADDARLAAEVEMGAKNSDTLAWDAGEGEPAWAGDPEEGVTEVHADLSLRSDSLSI